MRFRNTTKINDINRGLKKDIEEKWGKRGIIRQYIGRISLLQIVLSPKLKAT
jgi:hypothetical protein